MKTRFLARAYGNELVIADSSNLDSGFFKVYTTNAVRFNKKKILAYVKKQTEASPQEIGDLYFKLTSIVKEVAANV
jgi:hypothetical protein